jgi:hypothetical protein
MDRPWPNLAMSFLAESASFDFCICFGHRVNLAVSFGFNFRESLIRSVRYALNSVIIIQYEVKIIHLLEKRIYVRGWYTKELRGVLIGWLSAHMSTVKPIYIRVHTYIQYIYIC